MEYIVRGLGFLIIPVIVSGVLAFLRQPKKGEKGKVYLPKFLIILGLISSTLFLIPTVITAFLDEPIWIPLLFFGLSLIGACLIIAFVNCRIYYDENGFVAKNFFGIKRKFTYDQVTAIKEAMHENYVYIGKRKVMIDDFSIGGIEFIVYLKKRYRATHKGQNIPLILRDKHDLFKGNVEDVSGFIAAYVIVSIVVVVLSIVGAVYIFPAPDTVDNTIEQQVSFTSCIEKDDEIVLTSSDNMIYKIKFIGDEFNSDEIKSISNGKSVVTTYSKEVKPDNEDDYYSLKAILCGDTYLLSFEQTNRWHKEEYWPLIFFPIICTIAWGGFVAGSIIVGRNPKKHSKKVVKIFFQDGYVRY